MIKYLIGLRGKVRWKTVEVHQPVEKWIETADPLLTNAVYTTPARYPAAKLKANTRLT